MDSEQFREWRRARYRTQDQAGEAFGVTRETIHAWERDKRDVKWRLVELACRGLDLERQEKGLAV